jgi:hypothetical protein
VALAGPLDRGRHGMLCNVVTADNITQHGLGFRGWQLVLSTGDDDHSSFIRHLHQPHHFGSLEDTVCRGKALQVVRLIANPTLPLHTSCFAMCALSANITDHRAMNGNRTRNLR